MEQKLVSILMPAYNCENYVAQAIEAVLSQTYQNFELIMLDDCSTDSTKKIMDSYSDSRIKRFHNEINLGYLQSSNKLVNYASGDYLTFQDADDLCVPNRLEQLVSFLEQHPNISCVGSNIHKTDQLGNIIHTTNYPVEHDAILSGLLNYHIVMTGSSLMVRQEVLNSIGLYNLYFDRIGSEDTYWFTQIIEKYKVANLQEPLYFYRTNPTSVGFTHKNIKALGGHNISIECFKMRRQGKVDDILNGNYPKADNLMWYIIAKIKLEQQGLTAIKFLFKAVRNHPWSLFNHLRSILSIIKRHYANGNAK